MSTEATIDGRDFAVAAEKRLPVEALTQPQTSLALLIRSGPSTAGEVPAELRDVLTQLRGTLNYRNYELLHRCCRGLQKRRVVSVAMAWRSCQDRNRL